MHVSMNNEILSILSLAMKGGKAVSGEFQVMEAVKKKKACLVILAEDASDNTKKLFSDKAGFRDIPVITLGTKEILGRAIGKKDRSNVAILDPGFTSLILKKSGKV